MFRLKALILSVLLICPCALCYGQLSFSGVNGERGYAALKGFYHLDLDNGFTLTPGGRYYRMSDKEEDESGAMTKASLSAGYAPTDALTLHLYGAYIPKRLGFRDVMYGAGARYELCYRCGPFKNIYAQGNIGQSRYKIGSDLSGAPIENPFKTNATAASLEAGSEWGRFLLQARYDKVIKYSSKPPDNVTSFWTEIPYMVAVVQGFVRDIAAVRVSYRTRWVTPYAVYTRYKYLANSDYTVSVAGGLAVHWGPSTLGGGVEIFEQNRQENRRTYFSVSASTEF